MKIRRIAVIGLGQIGGSLVLALRRTKLPLHITGIERNPERLHLIRKHLDLSLTSWKTLAHVDLLIFCLHSRTLMKYLASTPSNALLMDVCSGKEEIVQLAKRRRLRFIGGHPMTGNEYTGEAGWDRDLFHDAPFFLCPTSNVSPSKLTQVKHILSCIGAFPIEVDPAEHDRFVARTSHFPAFLSQILRRTTSPIPEVFKGPGYRSMLRLSKTSPELLQTFLDTNRKNILKCATGLQRHLTRWIRANST